MLEEIENPKAKMDRLLSIDETAAILGLSKKTLYSWISRRQVEVVKISNRVMFEPRYIREYIEKHTVKAIGAGKSRE